MESSRFSCKKPLGVNELYAEWSKNLTNYCLPLLGESIRFDPQAFLPDTDVDNIMNYLTKHYETLSTSSDNETIRNTLFPTGNETQLFFIGDVHPCLFTSLIRSLINSTWKDDQMVRKIDEIERRMMVIVSELTEQMSKAQIRFVARVSKNWVSSEAGTEASPSVVAVDEAAKEEKEELVRIFVAANGLRKRVLKEIFKAITGIQAAKFLESLCAFLAGFKDQPQQQHHTPEPEPSLSHDLEKNNMEEEEEHTTEADESENRTLWIGNVGDKMETEYIHRCLAETGEVVSFHFPSYRVAADGTRIGFGFIEFISPDAAERALQTYDNTFIPDLVPPRRFKLKWAMKTKKRNTACMFISDLADDVTDDILLKTFTDHGYSSAISAMVYTDTATGRSRGGCVRFSDQGQMLLAMERMNGVECSNRPMRITPRRRN